MSPFRYDFVEECEHVEGHLETGGEDDENTVGVNEFYHASPRNCQLHKSHILVLFVPFAFRYMSFLMSPLMLRFGTEDH